MNELVIMHNKQAVTTSLRVAEVFGKDHKHVLETISNLAAEKSAAKFFAEATYNNRGKQYPMYYMNRDGFTLLAMGFTGKRALQFKIQYIQAFNSMETQIRTGYAIPGSYAEALKLAANQAEKIEQQKQTIAIQAPKALFADAVATSHTTILVGDLAKVIKQNGVDIGAKRLFAWMREQGYLIKRIGADYNSPTQRAMELGLFEVKETAISHSDGHVTVQKTPKVTGKGQQYFINKFLQKEMAV
ncbi:phage antirepressor KilAC domain-containing protein [Lacticaseibacillus paracasei]|uniref:phage antirepressor KilAC domain-containing protein n=1 Tax=Lacticaseibacillus paracasei TaxID=1597 RepID=UPI000F0B890F|nr:phage antirepressor KilAC domain-containing protein [Lacticaseibacillus paracasei]RNE05500.1 phage regulatory protein, Rha family [Lacticaseibacillus paracasei]